MKTKLAFPPLILAVWGIFAPAAAGTYTWSGGTEGKWNDSGNWSGGDTGYPEGGDTAVFNTDAVVLIENNDTVFSGMQIAAGATATLKSVRKSGSATVASTVKFHTISGAGTLELDGIYLTGRTDMTGSNVADVAIKFSGSLENRVIKAGTFSNEFNGSLTGEGTVRFGCADGASSSYQQIFRADNSGFSGLMYINGKTADRLHFATEDSASENARFEIPDKQAGMIENDFKDGTLRFGSFYTVKVDDTASILRFGNGAERAVTLEIGALNGVFRGESVIDRITLAMGTASTSAKARIKKVGTGTLQIGNTRHANGTEIANGIVEAVHSNSLRNGDVTFTGGSLRYGDRCDESDTADWADLKITDSTSDIEIDTNGKNVTYTTAIDSSNTGNFVKNGSGTLTLGAVPALDGKICVNEGALSVKINSNPDAAKFEVASGAEITYVNANGSATFNSTGIGNVAGNAVVNLDRDSDTKRMWRLQGYPFGGSAFSGTVKLLNTALRGDYLDGFVEESTELGNENAAWKVAGSPSTANSLLLSVVGKNNATTTVRLGSFNMPSPNGAIYIARPAIMEIGNIEGSHSVVNGRVALRSASQNAVFKKTGNSKLTLGDTFQAIAMDQLVFSAGSISNPDSVIYRPSFVVEEGEFENNADLTGYSVTLSNGVTLSGSGTWPAGMVLPASYTVNASTPGDTLEALNIDVDFSQAVLGNIPSSADGLDKETTYPIFTAKSISNWTSRIVEKKSDGVWKIMRSGNSLVLKFCPKGLAVIIR